MSKTRMEFSPRQLAGSKGRDRRIKSAPQFNRESNEASATGGLIGLLIKMGEGQRFVRVQRQDPELNP